MLTLVGNGVLYLAVHVKIVPYESLVILSVQSDTYPGILVSEPAGRLYPLLGSQQSPAELHTWPEKRIQT